MNKNSSEAFVQHAIDEYPNECCGLLVIVKGREKYIRCRNTSPTAKSMFIISVDDYSDAEELGEVVAVLHSHPDGPIPFTQADLVSCEVTGLVWHLVAVYKVDGELTTTPITTTSPKGYKAPLVGREFFHGILDCYSLIRDWYKEERDITLPNFERKDAWWDDGHSDLYTDGFASAGFYSVGQSAQPQIGDVILMQVRAKNGVPNHAAIYLGDGQILHHLYGRLSSRDIYGGFWREVTRDILRYKV